MEWCSTHGPAGRCADNPSRPSGSNRSKPARPTSAWLWTLIYIFAIFYGLLSYAPPAWAVLAPPVPNSALTATLRQLPTLTDLQQEPTGKLPQLIKQTKAWKQEAQSCLTAIGGQARELDADLALIGPAQPREPAVLTQERTTLQQRKQRLAVRKGTCEVLLLKATDLQRHAERILRQRPTVLPIKKPPRWALYDVAWVQHSEAIPAQLLEAWQDLRHRLTRPLLRGWAAGLLVGGVLGWLAYFRLTGNRKAFSPILFVLFGSWGGFFLALKGQPSLPHWFPWAVSWLGGCILIAALLRYLVGRGRGLDRWGRRAGLAGAWLLLAAQGIPLPTADFVAFSNLAGTLAGAGAFLFLLFTDGFPADRPGQLARLLALVAILSLILLPWAGYPYLALQIWPFVLAVTTILIIFGAGTRWQWFALKTRAESEDLHLWILPSLVLTWLTGLALITALLPLPPPARASLNRALIDGFQAGSLTVAPLRWGAALLSLLAMLAANRAISRFLEQTPYFGQMLPMGSKHSLITVLRYLGVLLATLLSVAIAGLGFHNLALVAGALSVGIGFGLQGIVANFIAGLLLLFERPVKPGDWISVTNHEGYVDRISFRSTVLRTLDGADVFIPNSDMLAHSVINWMHSDSIARLELLVGAPYDSDPETILDLLKSVTLEDPDILRQAELAPQALFLRFGAYSLEFSLRVYLTDVRRRYTVASALHTRILHAFRAAGISMPYPIQTVELQLGAGRTEKTVSKKVPPAGDVQ